MPILPDILAELHRLIEAAHAKPILMRAIGGLAIRVKSGDMQRFFTREYRDLDFVIAEKERKRIEPFFQEMGYEANRQFNLLNGSMRQIYLDPDSDRHVDIFVGKFEMCHKLPMDGRLEIDPVTVPLAELFLSKAHHVHALVVAEEEDQPLGIISDFDLLAGEWLSVDEKSLNTMRKLTARDLMTSPIESIDLNTSVNDAAKRMADKGIHRTLVTDNDKPVGILSISDLVAEIAAQEEIKREIVGDVMSRTFLVCREDNTVLSAARTMTQAGWRSIIVVNSKGKLQGVIAGRDLVPLAGTTVDSNLKVSELMNRKLITTDIHSSLQEAADIMIQNHRHQVIVVDQSDPDSFPLGVISSFDIVAAMARPGSVWQREE